MQSVYYDFEFLEGTQGKTFMGIKYGGTLPTIQPISVGMVSDDNREYYAIFNDFNLKEAWNRFDEKIETMYGDARNIFPDGRKTKVYWIRENILRPLFLDLCKMSIDKYTCGCNDSYTPQIYADKLGLSYKSLKMLIKNHGKSTKQIAKELLDFFMVSQPVNLYAYFGQFDHVCLAWVYGKMDAYPKILPQYTIDLKQILDEKSEKYEDRFMNGNETTSVRLSYIEAKNTYPKQTNEHNSLSDARFNKQLHEFIKTL